MKALTLSATRRRDLIGRAALSKTKKVVILTGPAIGASYSTPISVRLSRTLSSAWQWAKCRCTFRGMFRVLFCEKVSLAVAVVVMAAMWWHNISIDNVIEAQEAVGYDCLLGMPWGIVWAFRATFADVKSAKSSTKSLCSAKKGGNNARI